MDNGRRCQPKRQLLHVNWAVNFPLQSCFPICSKFANANLIAKKRHMTLKCLNILAKVEFSNKENDGHWSNGQHNVILWNGS